MKSGKIHIEFLAFLRIPPFAPAPSSSPPTSPKASIPAAEAAAPSLPVARSFHVPSDSGIGRAFSPLS